MAHRADAGNTARLTVQFGTAGVGVDSHAVERLYTTSITILSGVRQLPFVRPDSAGSTAVGLALTGIDHIDLLHLIVTVPVVVGIVHFSVSQLQGFNHHLGRMFVVTLGVIRAIVGLFLADSYRAYHVEVQFELTLALLQEVVAHRTFKVAFRIILPVGNALVEGFVVATLERAVLEVDQNDEALLITRDATHLVCPAWRQPLHAAAVGVGTALPRLLRNVLAVHHLIDVSI